MRRVVVGVVSAVSMAAMVIACNGGGGPMTIEEYFTELEQIEADSEERGDALADPFEAGDGTSVEERREAVREFRDGAADVFSEYLDAFEDLHPPDETADLHEEYGEAIEEFAAAFDDYLEELAASETVDDEQELGTGDALTRTLARVNEACIELQDLAADSDIEVDLRCNSQ